MKENVTFSLNDQVKVKLSDKGIEIYEVYFEKGISPYYTPPTIDKDGYYTTQWWMLMEVFGQYTAMHLPSPFASLIVVMDSQHIQPLPHDTTLD